MKGLLHSKRFRKNLSKWIFMYIGVMGLLTTVITYSKYISTLNASDSARVAKFKVNVSTNCKDTLIDGETGNNVCNNQIKYRPTNIEYYFTVDTRELEVLTDLVVNIHTNEFFEIIKIVEVNSDSLEEIDGKDLYSKEAYSGGTRDNSTFYSTNTCTNGFCLATLKRQVEPALGDKKTYKVIIKVKDIDSFDEAKVYNIFKVGFSATQTQTREGGN